MTTRIPTEYFRINSQHEKVKELSGSYNGEFLNDEDGYSVHLAIGKKLTRAERGDIIIEGISREGWKRILNDTKEALTGNPAVLKQTICQLDYIAWDKPFINQEAVKR